jgi:hypothetical protein
MEKEHVNKSITQHCIHHDNGNCHYLMSAHEKCNGLCNAFATFNSEIRAMVNKRLSYKDHVKHNDSVDKYSLDLAFSHPHIEGDSIQELL